MYHLNIFILFLDCVSASSSSSESSSEEEEAPPVRILSEQEMNEIGAKIIRAEIMGNEVRVNVVFVKVSDS